MRWAWAHALISGVFLHAVYLGGVWWAIRQGLPASVSALIAAVQPIATAALAPALLGERGSWRRSLGVALGLVGLILVLWPKLSAATFGAGALAVIGVNVLAMFGATAGFFYQKRFLPSGDLRAIAGLQYAGAFAVMLPAAFALEPMRIEWNATMALVLAWSVLALSIGADLAAAAADPPRRSVARLGADLSRAADRRGAGFPAVRRDA